MSYSYDYPQEVNFGDGFAADAALSERLAFIRRTYAHLFGAILAFVGLISLFLYVEPVRVALFQLIGGNWWLAFIAFMIVSWLAQRWAHSDTSRGIQYLGLALYTVAEAFIFVPLLVFAQSVGGPQIIPTAGLLTLLIFGGLTAVVFITKQDFSFLRMALMLGSFAALGFIIAGLFIGFSPNIVLFFVVGMIILMSGYILYDTSNVLHHYRTTQHVAAALALFASIATLFYYVLYLLSILSGRD